MYTNVSNQAAPDWELTLTGDPTNGSTIQIDLDDNDQAADANCDDAADSVVFGGTPTIAAVAPDTTTYTVAMTKSDVDCPGNDK